MIVIEKKNRTGFMLNRLSHSLVNDISFSDSFDIAILLDNIKFIDNYRQKHLLNP